MITPRVIFRRLLARPGTTRMTDTDTSTGAMLARRAASSSSTLSPTTMDRTEIPPRSITQRRTTPAKSDRVEVSISESASSIATGLLVGIHSSAVCIDTVRASPDPAIARDAATDTAVSKERRSHESILVSSTTMWWERWVSSNWRTIRRP